MESAKVTKGELPETRGGAGEDLFWGNGFCIRGFLRGDHCEQITYTPGLRVVVSKNI